MRYILTLVLSLVIMSRAAAQIPCGPGWIPVGTNGSVFAFTLWNSKLVAAGTFTQIGGVSANRIAVFDGQTWAPLGTGLDNTVRALTVYNDQLYAGGDFLKSGASATPYLARFNGTAWEKPATFGPSGPVYALAARQHMVMRGGSPDILLIGGTFMTPYPYLLRYMNGLGYTQVSTGINGPVYGLVWLDIAYLVLGDFTLAGGNAAKNFTVYNQDDDLLSGSTNAFNGAVRATVISLIAGTGIFAGDFTKVGATDYPHVVSVSGANFSPMGAGLNNTVYALLEYESVIYAGGSFTKTGVNNLVGLGRFNGAAWEAVGGGVNGAVRALVEFNGELWVGGDFATADGVSSQGLARYTATGTPWFTSVPTPVNAPAFGSASFSIVPAKGYETVGLTYQWYRNGNPLTSGLQPSGATVQDATSNTLVITEVTPAEAGNYACRASGPCGEVYLSPFAVLSVTLPGPCTPDWIAAFPAAPTLDGSVRSITAWDDDGNPGTPAETVLAGAFKKFGKTLTLSRIALWDGSAFQPMADGFNNTVNVIKPFDADGPGGNPPWLVAGGSFTKSGTTATPRIARWNGVNWAGLGSGFNGNVNALTTFDFDGAGGDAAQLVAAGAFTKSGTVGGINRIARYDSGNWRPIGQGFNGEVKCLLVGDPDGPGPIGTVLIAGGNFTKSGTTKINRVAYWDGNAWQPIGDGFNGSVNAMTIIYGSFYCGGAFTKSGTTKINRVAALVDDTFEQIGDGFNGAVNAFEVADLDGLGPADVRLYAVGAFTKSGTSVINRVAVLDGDTGVWQAVGAGANAAALCLATTDIPSGQVGTKALLVGGDFKTIDGLAQRTIAAYRCSDAMLVRFAAARPASIADLCGTGGSDTPPDGQVTIDDVIAFMVAVGEDDPAADLVAKDGADTGPDWQVTIDDVIAFVEAFATSP